MREHLAHRQPPISPARTDTPSSQHSPSCPGPPADRPNSALWPHGTFGINRSTTKTSRRPLQLMATRGTQQGAPLNEKQKKRKAEQGQGWVYARSGDVEGLRGFLGKHKSLKDAADEHGQTMLHGVSRPWSPHCRCLSRVPQLSAAACPHRAFWLTPHTPPQSRRLPGGSERWGCCWTAESTPPYGTPSRYVSSRKDLVLRAEGGGREREETYTGSSREEPSGSMCV